MTIIFKNVTIMLRKYYEKKKYYKKVLTMLNNCIIFFIHKSNIFEYTLIRLFEDRKAAIKPEMVLKRMWGTPSHQVTKTKKETL